MIPILISNIELERLWSESASIWDLHDKSKGFEAYVPADYRLVYERLLKLKGRAETFLEWGSGLGIVTIMASRLGFDAYGVEISPELVEHAERLSLKYGADATFSTGSFVPNAYEWDPEMGEDGLRTDFDAPDGYDELGMDLSDFDIVYAYPWPDEHAVFQDIMRRHGAPGALFMTYDAHEAVSVKKMRRKSRH